MDSLQRLRGYTYTCRLRDGTLHLVTPVWGHAPLYSGFFFENDGGTHAPRDERPIAAQQQVAPKSMKGSDQVSPPRID